jgi:flap endonuclease-1
MGIPSFRAPSEGEAQLATMAMEGDIWASASQDWDTLLFNSPRLIRNLTITGRKKLPKKSVYIKIKPEIIELEATLKNLEITREQLIAIGLLIGTDYNPGVKGVGPKNALRIVKEYKTIDRILENVDWQEDVNIKEVFNLFLNPLVNRNYEIKWREPNIDKLIELLVEEHDFSQKRVEKFGKTLDESFSKPKKDKTLEGYFS